MAVPGQDDGFFILRRSQGLRARASSSEIRHYRQHCRGVYEVRNGPVRARADGGTGDLRGLDTCPGRGSGVIYSEGWSLDTDQSPALFGLCYLAHVLIVVMCLAFAAGYTPAELKQFAWAMTGAGR